MAPRLHLSRPAMRFDLKVPFAEKDAAKKLGARWDAGRKLWYVMGDRVNVAAFAKWSPLPADAAAPAPAAPKQAAARGGERGTLIVGPRYVERPRVCECLPWEDCARCRAQAA